MNGFKVGDKVVCINNYHVNLTLYKTYVVVRIIAHSTIEIIDNENVKVWYTIYRFITLKEYRLLKLKKLI